MSGNSSIKNYYQILGVPESASLFEIESAYEKLASAWHPDKHKQHRKSAELKFQEIAEAFQVLSDRNKRSHYDELLNKHSSLEEANSTFQSFFNEHGAIDQQEVKFFNQHYPDPLNSYYKILGVTKSATLEEIKNAYRKLALKYHPKNNPNDQTARAKFIEINEAFNALSNEHRRQNYDRILFGQIAPIRAHNIFDDFFGSRLTNFDDDFFGPWFQRKWTRDLDRLMIDEKDEKVKNGETIKTSSVWSNNNGQQSRKTVTTKRSVNDGKATEEVTEDYLYPSGERKVVKTRNADGKVERKNYTLKKGEQLPKELTE